MLPSLVPEADVRGVPALVSSLLADPGRLEKMAAAMRRTARPDAAEEIADEVLALAGV